MSYTATNDSLAPRFVVNDPGTVKVNVQHGFDKCSHPDLDDMQVWWNKSPYVVFNLYLGGVSYACKNNPLDAVYVRQLAEQGWWFIPTWVGPQAPCSKYTYKMSYGDAAYQEGRDEADEAYKRAEALGLFGQKIIYYDLEAYSGDTTCRNSVKKFIRGWTERLHELGSKAGGYGASCRSYIEDWAQNDPPPDDIWIAHWILDEYDPSATVWNAVCLDPTTTDPPDLLAQPPAHPPVRRRAYRIVRRGAADHRQQRAGWGSVRYGARRVQLSRQLRTSVLTRDYRTRAA